MTAVIPSIAKETRSQRITRRLGNMLAPLGVDPLQYHYLLQASLMMDLRSTTNFGGRRTNSTRSALRSTVLMNFFYSCVMGFIVAPGGGVFFYDMLLIGYAMVMVAMMVLMEFGLVVISPDDHLILAHRPISSRTFLAVRISNLLFYVLVLGLSLNIAPSFLGLMCRNTRIWFPLVYLPVSMLAVVFVAGAVTGFYGLMIRWMNVERFKDVLMYCQIALSFVFFFGYQVVPRMAMGRHQIGIGLTHTWAALFPSVWFAGLLELCLGRVSSESMICAAVSLGVALVVLPILLRSISLDYSDRLGRMMTASNRTKSTGKTGTGILARLFQKFPRDEQKRAVFLFVLTMMRRNRRVKLQLLPNLGVMLGLMVVMMGDPHNRADPFGPDSGTGVMLGFTAMAFLLGGMALAVALPYSDESAGAWIFGVAPISKPGVILKAIKLAAMILIYVPFTIVCIVGLSFFWPVLHATEAVLYGLLAGLAALNLVLLRFEGFPFTRKPEKGAQSRQLATAMIMMLGVGIMFVLQAILPHTQWVVAIVLSVLFILWMVLDQLSNYIYARKPLEVEPA